MEAREIRLVLLCAEPPEPREPAATFGLQDKKQALHAGEVLADGALRFVCVATVRPQRQTGAPDWAGPFVHGPLGERFLYLSLQDLRSGSWIRRSKVALAGIGWDLVEAVGQTPGAALRARVQGVVRPRAQLLDGGWRVEQ